MAVTSTFIRRATKRKAFYEAAISAAKPGKPRWWQIKRWIEAEVAADPTGKAVDRLHEVARELNASEWMEVTRDDDDGERQPA